MFYHAYKGKNNLWKICACITYNSVRTCVGTLGGFGSRIKNRKEEKENLRIRIVNWKIKSLLKLIRIIYWII